MSQSIRIASAEAPGAYRVVGVNKNYRTIEIGDLSGTARIVPEEVCEFVLRLGDPGRDEPSIEVTAADCQFVREDGDDSHAILHFECADRSIAVEVHLSAGPGPRLRKWLTITNTGGSPFVLFDAVLEQFRLAPNVHAWGGGRGWPVFVGGLGYFAIEHPEAENRLVDGTCILEYYPAVTIEAGDSYQTECALLELAPDNPEAALRRYTDEFRIRKSDGLFTCYGTWGSHEHEGPDERTVNQQLDHLIDLKSNWRVPFENLILDRGYWGESDDPLETGRYSIDRETRFPGESFERIVERLSAADIGLGMWFGVEHIENDEFLFNLMASITEMRSRYGLRLLKADASRCEGSEPDKYMRYRTARLLADVFASVKAATPDMLIMATAFSRSPWWLKHVDYVTVGQVGPSDVPAPSLRDSQIINTDLDHRFFELDSGTNIGYSDAGFWSGKQFWRKSVIMSMVRSNQLYIAGDLGILDDEDRQTLQRMVQHHNASRQLFGHAKRVMGSPAAGDVYGYANVKDRHAMVALYNPSWTARRVELQALDIGCDPDVRNMVIELFPSTQAGSMLEWESCDLRFDPWEMKLLEIAPSEEHYELFESRAEMAGRYMMPITPVTLPADGPDCLSLPLERVFYQTGSAFRCHALIPKEWEGYPVMLDLRGLRGELYINNLPSGIFGGSFAACYPGTREYGRLAFGRSDLWYVAVDDPDVTSQPDLVIRPLGYSSSSTCREDWPHAKVSSMVVIIRLRQDGKPVSPSTDPRMMQCAVWLDGISMQPYRVPPLVPRIWSGYSWGVFALDLEGDWECARVVIPHLLDADYEIDFFLTDRIPAISDARG